MHSLKRFLLLPAFCVLKTGLIFCQSIPAKISFPDGTTRNVSLDNRSFKLKNELKVKGEVIPIIPDMKIETKDIVYEVKKVTLLKYDRLPEITTIKIEEIDTTVIVKKLIGGTINLYKFVEGGGFDHWFLEKKGEVFELIEIEYTKDSRIGRQERYKDILRNLIPNCPAVRSQINQISFNEQAIQKVVANYNRACGALNYINSKPKRTLEFGVNLGYQVHTSKLPRGTRFNNSLDALGLGEITSQSPVLGLYFRVPLTKRIDRLSFSFNAHYIHSLSFDLVDSLIAERNEPDTTITSLAFGASYYGATPALRFTLPLDKSKFKPYVEIGLEIRDLLKVKENFFRLQRLKRPLYDRVGQNGLIGSGNLPNHKIYYRFRTGVKYENFEFGLNYFFGPGGFTSDNPETQTGFGVDFRYAIF